MAEAPAASPSGRLSPPGSSSVLHQTRSGLGATAKMRTSSTSRRVASTASVAGSAARVGSLQTALDSTIQNQHLQAGDLLAESREPLRPYPLMSAASRSMSCAPTAACPASPRCAG